MSIDVRCNCGQRFRASEALAGRTVICSKCNSELPIPASGGKQSVTSPKPKPLFRRPRFIGLVGGCSLLLVVAVVVLSLILNQSSNDTTASHENEDPPRSIETSVSPITDQQVPYAPDPSGAETLSPPDWDAKITVWTLAISADGRHIAAFVVERSAPDYPKSLRLWNTATGKLVREFEQPNRANRLSFSPDGSLVLGAGSILDDNKLEVTENRIWATSTGNLVATFPGSLKYEVGMSKDNRTVFNLQDHAITATNIKTGEATRFAMQNEAKAEVVAFDQSGRVGVAVAWDPTPLMQVFDLQSAEYCGDALQLDCHPYLMAIDRGASWLATIGTVVKDD